MSKIFQFGENVEGYSIPVLNEREIRASAGILFTILLIAVNMAGMLESFTLLKYFIIIFMVDFIIRLFINPKFAPLLIIGRLIVRRQTPEYVGAAQKKFAWGIGLGLATLMFFLAVVLNSFSIITGLSCLFCLIFLLFESAFGICLGCLIYRGIKKDKAQYCPGEICEVKDRQPIQKTSLTQIAIVAGLVVYIVAAVILFNDNFVTPPTDLWELLKSS